MSSVLIVEKSDSVVTLTLNRPEAMNALSAELRLALGKAFREIQRDPEVRVAILTGAGRAFCAGMDLKELSAGSPQATGEEALGAGQQELIAAIAAFEGPILAAVNGHAVTGGFELALACDLIVAEENAELGAPEIKLGVFPPAASALLPVRIGTAGAASMILTGTNWTGRQAFQQGLVARVAPEGELAQVIDRFLDDSFVHRSAVALHLAARAVRRTVIHALYEELPKLDQLYLEVLMKDDEAVEGIRAFLERRDPSWVRRDVPA
jgi:cyclohexa-1,5-dienecarbonyl-CoA hydratase